MIKTNIEFVHKVKEIATNYKTLYVMGCFGAPLKEEYKDRYCNNYDYNKQPVRTAMIRAASADTFGFDCVCLIKGLLWGWNGDKNHVYGGAEYCSNGVPDIDENSMINSCSGVTADFSKIEVGEAVWMDGHIGVYIGDGLAVECTPSWDNKVQITAVRNIGIKTGYNHRTWTKHGKLPYFTYVKESTAPEKPVEPVRPLEPTKEDKKITVGTILNFSGGKQYAASQGDIGYPAKAGKVRITLTANGALHPYHAVSEDESGTYGWVDADTLSFPNEPDDTAKTEISLKAGTKIALNKVALYSAAEEKSKASTLGGIYYLYDGVDVNGFVRICPLDNVGKTPIAESVTGWVKISDIS